MEMTTTTYEKCIGFINYAFNIPMDQLDLNFDIRNQLVEDSLEFVDFVLFVEKHFRIDLSDEEAASIQTIRDLVACLERYLPTPRPCAEVVGLTPRTRVDGHKCSTTSKAGPNNTQRRSGRHSRREQTDARWHGCTEVSSRHRR